MLQTSLDGTEFGSPMTSSNMNPLAAHTEETTPTLLDYPPPTWLKHQPMFLLPYAPFDGPYANHTDAKYLSIGRAQWRTPTNDPHALSAKVWRYPDNKWSRMSEEIPLHRLADLCTLMTISLFQQHQTRAVAPTVLLPAGTLDNQQQDIELRRLHEFPEPQDYGEELTKRRLRVLRDQLNKAALD